MATSVASIVQFSDLCEVFEKTRTLKRQDKGNAIIDFIRRYKEKGAELKYINPNVNASFYPALRLMLPQLERERGAYGLKEHTLAKRLIKILCIQPEGSDAKRLMNFRASTNYKDKDFADTAYWILQKYFTKGSVLSIADVNRYLDAVATKHSENDPRGADDALFKMLRESSAQEQKWLLRIILKDMRLGVGHDRMLKLFHPDAADFYSTNESLAKVCETLADASARLHELELTIFTPFRPMLSQRCDIAQFRKTVTGLTSFYVETKFDGERFQLHMENGKFKYFSRNGYDYTSTYGTDYTNGLYTPLLKNTFKPHVKRIILDGEMMGWDSKRKMFGSKGMSFDVKHLNKDTTFKPCLCVFDLLLLNDRTLTNRPLKERLLLLDTIVTPANGVIMISHRMEANTKQDILNALNKSMDRKEEGIIIKDPTSIYKPNDRKAGWWKMKLEYFENVMSDLDLIIMGGYHGEGRHRQQISGFSVGVAVPPTDRELKPGAYLSLARVSSGLSNEELETIERKLGPHWRQFNRDDPDEHGLQWGRDKPDVWIPPNKSCVVTVRASELVRVNSGDFKVNYTLRFPRIQRVRLDKLYYDCMTNAELQELTGESSAVTKLNKRHLELSDLDVPEKERKVRKRYMPEEVRPVEQVTQMLVGYEFCVLTGDEEWKKEMVEVVVRENGGTVVKNEGGNTFCILVGDDHPRVSSCKQFNVQCDLVRLKWLRDILNGGIFKFYEPKDALHLSVKTKNRFMVDYDKYGDSYVEDATMESLNYATEMIKESNDYAHLMPTEIDQLDREMCYVNSTNVFKCHIGYFDKLGRNYKVHSSKMCGTSLEEMDFKFLGGSISDILDENVTMVVLNTDDETRKTELLNHLTYLNSTDVDIVHKSFISEKLTECENLLL